MSDTENPYLMAGLVKVSGDHQTVSTVVAHTHQNGEPAGLPEWWILHHPKNSFGTTFSCPFHKIESRNGSLALGDIFNMPNGGSGKKWAHGVTFTQNVVKRFMTG
jgi:hypothetical protein